MARAASMWIHWWSPVASANWSMRSCVISSQSLTPISWPVSCFSSSREWITRKGIGILFYHIIVGRPDRCRMDESEIKERLGVLLSACQQANAAPDPRPLLGLIAREVAALAALLEPARIVGRSPKIRVCAADDREYPRQFRQRADHRRAGHGQAVGSGHDPSHQPAGPRPVPHGAPGAAPDNLAEIFRRARGGALFFEGSLRPGARRRRARSCAGSTIRKPTCAFWRSSARDLEAETARGALPPRSVLPAAGDPHRPAAAARNAGGYSAAGRSFSGAVLRRVRARSRGFSVGSARRTGPPAMARQHRPTGGGGALLVRGRFKDAVARLEKEMIEEALQAAHSNQCQAAKALG